MPDTWTPAQAEAENEAASAALDKAVHRRATLLEACKYLAALERLDDDASGLTHEDRSMLLPRNVGAREYQFRVLAEARSAVIACEMRCQIIAAFINAAEEQS